MRRVLAIVAGYAIFAVSAAALFQLSGRPSHQAASTGFMIETIVYGMCFAAAGGYVAGRLAPREPFVQALWVAAVIATGAVVSLLTSPGGAHWSQFAALCLMAPAAAAGGLFQRNAGRSRHG
jgi:hypothetical protein